MDQRNNRSTVNYEHRWRRHLNVLRDDGDIARFGNWQPWFQHDKAFTPRHEKTCSTKTVNEGKIMAILKNRLSDASSSLCEYTTANSVQTHPEVYYIKTYAHNFVITQVLNVYIKSCCHYTCLFLEERRPYIIIISRASGI